MTSFHFPSMLGIMECGLSNIEHVIASRKKPKVYEDMYVFPPNYPDECLLKFVMYSFF